MRSFVFFFNDTATTEIYTLSLHDALPISMNPGRAGSLIRWNTRMTSRETAKMIARSLRTWYSKTWRSRSEEHTSELQSPCNIVCRLLLEKKKAPLVPTAQPKAIGSSTNSD